MRLSLTAWAVAMSLFALPAAATEVPKITLKQALAAALANNPRLAQSRALIEQSTAAIGAARTAFDTALTIGLDGSLARRPSPDLASGAVQDSSLGGSVGYRHKLALGTALGVSIGQRFADSAGILSILAPQITTDLRVTVAQPILRGAGSEVNLAPVVGAEALREASLEDHTRLVENVLSEVASAYWLVVGAQAEVDIRRRAYDRAKEVQTLTQDLIKRGSLAQAASVQAASTTGLRRARLDGAERALEEAELTLVRAILDQAPARVGAQDPLPEPGPPAQLPTQIDRADLRAAKKRAEAQQSQVVVAEDQTRPSLDLTLFGGLTGLGGTKNDVACRLFASGGGATPAGCADNSDFSGYGATFATLFGKGFYTLGLGVTLALPIVREAADAQAEVARIAVRQSEILVDELQRDAQAEATALSALVARDRASLITAEDARRVTAQLVDLEAQRYQVGSASTFDVLRVQDDLAEAEVLAARARASVMATDLRFALATGRVLEHLGVSETAPAATP
ncbi:MAG: TolC family protein [Myxococcota bacterium]